MASPVWSPGSSPRRAAAAAVVAAGLVAVAGLAYVKWLPYYHRLLAVSLTHTLGSSLFGPEGYFTAVNLGVAWSYAVEYFRSVWQAALLGLVLGGAVEAVLPATWIQRLLGARPRAVALAGLFALPGMMCSCCATPVVAGLRRQSASAGAAVAFWLANPVLNPATLAVLVMVLGWPFGLVRLIFGVLMVFGIGLLVDRLFPEERHPPQAATTGHPATRTPHPASASWPVRWLRSTLRLAAWIVPEYLVMVFLTGLLGGVFFPAGIGQWAHAPLALPLIALAGTLFVIPTMAEIPIVQGLMAVGLPTGPAAALLLTLPAVSLPGLVILGRSFRARTLGVVTLAVTLVGVAGGLVAAALL
ncbi:permease [Thermaerobacter composti]|uniref:Permease n=1 Tax=Thermaerobacter composti TaxID=554949 RepID=A0ABZ0QSP4_9FIRM|nr:permease [Thermaerobacter composti]WPD19779.1 permease [Thermaerobacter composti]